MHEPTDPATDPDADPESVARTILLRQLTDRSRSRAELATALRKKQVPDDVATRLLDRFTEVGLIDDEAFARSWVESRQRSKGLAQRALAMELRHKGVDDDIARSVLAEIEPDDERQAAARLVRRKLHSVRGVPEPARTRRLMGMLARRGYSSGLALSVVREELGADEAWQSEMDSSL